MIDHIENRRAIIDQVRRELVGPDPHGERIDFSQVVSFDSWEKYRGPYVQAENGDEVLVDQTPTQRYGVGVLFPMDATKDDVSAAMEGASTLLDDEHIESDMLAESAAAQSKVASTKALREDDSSADLDLTPANAFSPSSMAVSFLIDLNKLELLNIVASGGRYSSRQVMIREPGNKQKERTVWLRQPVRFSVSVPTPELTGTKARWIQYTPSPSSNGAEIESLYTDNLDLSLEILSRPTDEPTQRLLTVSLVNRTTLVTSRGKGAQSLFQSHISVGAIGPDGSGAIHPYPSSKPFGDEEQTALDMLYRNVPVFATGHGCSADWCSQPGSLTTTSVSAESLPVVSLPAVTPDFKDDKGDWITVKMGDLCSLKPDTESWNSLTNLVARYDRWIDQKASESHSETFPEQFRMSAASNIAECRKAAARMNAGLQYLKSNPDALQAFKLANEAMLRQQTASRLPIRPIAFDAELEKVVVSVSHQAPDTVSVTDHDGAWRPFQIAFLLSSVESTGNTGSVNHDLVDLIWFPTGGGKTEAYLGLSAYSMFLRRIRNPTDIGVNVLMRYTLRLLTTQQFERASSLICAMERIRSARQSELGVAEFSIGIWLGGETTPNWREQALIQLGQYQRDRNEDNPFLINKCPWCGAEIGRVQLPAKGKQKAQTHVEGYRRATLSSGEETVVIHCTDPQCPFAERLPILVIDEDVYASSPSLVIGTIDKFARLTWDDRPRRLFGIDEQGQRAASPPQLIIQDELHLISGPLGSLAGLLEPIIEDLCTDHLQSPPVRPKILCSTATTRRYREQVLGLYGRTDVCLFPPPGIEASDSYFARTDVEAPGKIYVGVHAAGFGSYQTEWVRALTAMVNAPKVLDSLAARDPWWTLLMFCNSLRDMGTAHTLLNTDVLDYCVSYWQRKGIRSSEGKRYVSNVDSVLELTGGLKRSEIKNALDLLSTPLESNHRTVDVCLATNIIEVGVDIPRLALMAVAGQPKTTAQYIQATGRVGRSTAKRDNSTGRIDRSSEKPGLVFTLYGPSKPRDRSHFEHFRAYHERLYAQVEPTSVTPFSPPALDRFLHSVVVAHVRQTGSLDEVKTPYPVPKQAINQAARILRDRLEKVDAEELKSFEDRLGTRIDEWSRWDRREWDTSPDGETPLLRHAGAYATESTKTISWSTMNSLRNVDAACRGAISSAYLNHATEHRAEVFDE